LPPDGQAGKPLKSLAEIRHLGWHLHFLAKFRDSCRGNAKYRVFCTPGYFPERTHFMNKNELIAQVAADAQLTKGAAGEAVEATLENIQKALQRGDDVRLVGFGTFTVSQRAATQGRDPRTGASIAIPASKNAKFKAGKALKEAVNG
jgi:DNA-binding protein HU-beta